VPDSLIDLAGLEVGVEDFLAAVLGTATQPIWVVDPEDVVRFANPAALVTLGYEGADELVGRRSHPTVHHTRPDGTPYPAEECPLRRPRLTGETVACDLDWFFRRDGSMFPVSYVSAPIELGEGRGAVVAFTDIEERLRAEGALHERDHLLAAQQASLLCVAELVTRGAASAEVFAAIAREVGQVTALPMVALWRYDSEGTATVIGEWSDRPHPFRVGTSWPLDGPTITAQVRASGHPARIESFEAVAGTIAGAARDTGIGSCAGAPIVVDGRVWGAMSGDTFGPEPLAEGIEDKLAEFTALVASAISNSLSRDALIQLADEQAALRRVATLVAQGASPDIVLDATVGEMQALLDADQVALQRFEANQEIVELAQRGVDRHGETVGARVAVEVTLDGRVWGLITASWRGEQPPPLDTEERMSKFAELLETAIASAEARAQRERLAEEQAALRRVATLVARESSPADLLGVVAEEVAGVLDTEAIGMLRFEPDGTATLVAQSETPWDPPPLGTRFTLEGENIVSWVFRSPRATRLDDWTNSTGMVAGMAQSLGIRSAVATPILVEGRVWGAMVAVTSQAEPLPAQTESRLGEFTELVATAISNAEARTELGASRTRLVEAADEERRRVVRDLHDGAQQRLVHIVITMKLALEALESGDDARALVAEALAEAEGANVELRELAHGILPAVVTRGGLRAGIETLASRAPVRIKTDVPSSRLPAAVEATAYFVVAEALTNVAKHSRADHAAVSAQLDDGELRVVVRDDGVGGARADGSGLLGISDRVNALDGHFELDSPPGGGTVVTARIPVPA
jgi:PAS domain S-box-containing protein